MSKYFTFDDSWNTKGNTSYYEKLADMIAGLLSDKYNTEDIKLQKRTIVYRANQPPQVSIDRTRIYVSALDCYQFIYQFSHELCHCITSNKNLPQSIKWFDEFLACFTSYFVLKELSRKRKDKVLRSIFGDKYNISITNYVTNGNYIDSTKKSQHYVGYDGRLSNLFFENYNDFLQYEDKIKLFDCFFIKYYNDLNNNFSGLTFLGKLYKVKTSESITINKYLYEASKVCNNEEISAIEIICNIFGLTISREEVA